MKLLKIFFSLILVFSGDLSAKENNRHLAMKAYKELECSIYADYMTYNDKEKSEKQRLFTLGKNDLIDFFNEELDESVKNYEDVPIGIALNMYGLKLGGKDFETPKLVLF